MQMQLKEIVESITYIGSFLASVGVIAYVIKRVGEFLSWSVFFVVVAWIGLVIINAIYIEPAAIQFLVVAFLSILVSSALNLGDIISSPKWLNRPNLQEKGKK